MPALTNSIGTETFLDLQGNLKPRSEDLQVLARPGVNDVRIRTAGVRGQPVRVRSIKYVASHTAAASKLDDYIALKDGAEYAVTQNSVSMGYYKVLDVSQVSERAILNAVGGEAGSEQSEQICEWTLIHVPAP